MAVAVGQSITATSFKGLAFRSIVARLALPSLPSLPSLPAGVGQSVASSRRHRKPPSSSCRRAIAAGERAPLLLSPSATVAVGQDEEPFSSVGRSNVGRSQAQPLRIEPERGQVTQDASNSHGKQTWDVFQEDEAWSHFANHPGNVGPEPPFVVLPSTLAGDADGLAGKAAMDEIHRSTPRVTIEGSNVRPDRSLIQPALAHTRDQDRSGIGFPFHVTDRASDSGEGEIEPSGAAAQADGT